MSAGADTADEKRSLEELFFLYEVEPDVRDVYVEGTIDVRIIRSLLAEHEVRGVTIYPIEAIAVPKERVQAEGFRLPNRRGELITLAALLAARIPSSANTVTCVVDSDLDVSLARRRDVHLLLYTDFACMESYVFDEVGLPKLLRFCGYNSEEHYPAILHSFRRILVERHCHRVANEGLDLGLKKIALKKFLRRNGGHVEFDSDEYLRRAMNKSAQSSERSAFDKAVHVARERITAEHRYYAHGHDLIELLEWLFHDAKCVAGKAVEDVVATAIYCVMEFRKLGEVGMFKQLLRRLTATSTAATPL